MPLRYSDSVAGSAQLLSLSIDPLGDDMRSMSAWLRKHGAGPHWIGAIPDLKQMDILRRALQLTNDRLDNHSGQVYLIDRRGVRSVTSCPQPCLATGRFRMPEMAGVSCSQRLRSACNCFRPAAVMRYSRTFWLCSEIFQLAAIHLRRSSRCSAG